MAIHMSLRLAWHDNGWNGYICKNPRGNSYCVGQYSYPGDLILRTRNTDFEQANAGISCKNFPCKVACGFSVNAFGNDTITVKADPPSFWYGEDYASPTQIELPPYTACTWCYEQMYGDDVIVDEKFDYAKRRKNAENYFAQFEPEKSLIFYYAGYSNPFSENEENNYVVVGVSRLKNLSPILFYDGASDSAKAKFAGAFIWEMPVTSNYPDEGFCIPYQKYMDEEDKLNKIVVKPLNRSPFKYGSREVSNDDAIEIINQLLTSVDSLIELNDTSEDWKVRKAWLNSLLAELWAARGSYPGFPAVLEYLGLNELISEYVALTNDADMKNYVANVRAFLDGTDNAIAKKFSPAEIKKIRRNYQLKTDEDTSKFLFNVLARFDLKINQVQALISDDREKVSVTATVEEMAENPYIISEQYTGYDSDDTIPLYKIDNGVLPSPNYGIKNLLDADSAERFRAFCVDSLKRIPAHSFCKALTILNDVNLRLERLSDWKKNIFSMKNFKADKVVLDEVLVQRKSDDELYLYLKEIYEDERTVEEILTRLADRPDISLKLAITPDKFKRALKDDASPLEKICPQDYDGILANQASICMKIFNKPLCVISGNAGTGKTTIIRAILDNIKRIHGVGTSFRLLAPTGKAAERIKIQTGESSSTIHSLLAQNGWINDNFTLKRNGGRKFQDVNTIIVDECSMIDLNLFATLLRAINWNSVQRLILIGDPNQLPPIGRGKVFVDTINWLKKNYPDNIGILTDNVRQLVNCVTKNGCGILELAEVFIQDKQQTGDAEILKSAKEKIFERIQLNGNGDIDKDLAVYFWKTQDDLEKSLLDVINNDLGLLQKSWFDVMNENPETIQVISPYRGEFYGTGSINLFMQKNFNAYWSKKMLHGIAYFDKVIQIRNRQRANKAFAYAGGKNSLAEILNGEIGRTIPHGLDYKDNKYKWASNIERFQVVFCGTSRQGLRYNYGKNLGQCDGKYIPKQEVLDNLELAYAISVHKAQGSEFDYVYIVLPQRDSHLLSMELLYTAFTRAQKKVTIFLQNDTSALTTMSRVEKSAVRKINSSVFEFKPLPEDIIYLSGKWYEAGKKISTLSDYLVRSKSEAIITNLLVDRDIPFKYEEPLYAADGTMFLPDFTVKFRGEDFYWEHLGMLHDPNYRAHWEKKKTWYDKNFPGKLIITAENVNLTKEAEKIIAKHV